MLGEPGMVEIGFKSELVFVLFPFNFIAALTDLRRPGYFPDSV